jgi:uncharacterized protein YqeY
MLIDELKKANLLAMKNHDVEARSILSVVINRYDLFVKGVAPGAKPADDDLLIHIIDKTIKELHEEYDGYVAVKNTDRANRIKLQESVISMYLPKKLSEVEIKKIISSLPDKSIPSVMKHFKEHYGSQVDMGLVSKLAKSA